MGGSEHARRRALIVAPPTAIGLAARVAREIGLDLHPLGIERCANRNLVCHEVPAAVRGAEVFVFQRIGEDVHSSLMELLLALRSLAAADPSRLVAVVPYLPYSRSDRPESPGGAVGARLVADLIADAGAQGMIGVDLHSSQIAGFFRVPFLELSARGMLSDAVKRWRLAQPVVISPDLGGAKRADAIATMLGCPLALVRKRRRGEHVEGLELLGAVRGSAAVIVDDEIATGGTIESAATLALQNGATEVNVVATHAVLVESALARLERARLRRVLVTDTLPWPPGARSERLEMVSVAPLIASALVSRASPGALTVPAGALRSADGAREVNDGRTF